MSDLIQRLEEVHDYLEGKYQGAYKNTVIDAICKIKDLEQKLADAEKEIESLKQQLPKKSHKRSVIDRRTLGEKIHWGD